MIIEQYITCPETRSKLCKGPLAHLINGFCFWLKDLGFSHGLIYLHLLNISRFNDYLAEVYPQSLTVVSSLDVDDFFKNYFLPCHKRAISTHHLKSIHYALNRFVAYLKELDCFIDEKRVPLYQSLLDAYLSWLKRYQHLAAGSIELRRHSITHLFSWLGPQATLEGLSKLTSPQIETFFLTCAKDMGRSARRSLQAALRTFFRFCLQKGLIKQHLDKAVPTLRTYKLATVPREIDNTLAKEIIQSIDKSTSVGKRDHAILMLLYTFGVRAGQVAALRLTDIHWAKAQIYVKASKNGKSTLLPLTEEVGNSLFDYIKQARPASECPEVFITSRGPYRSLCHSSAISELVRRHVIQTGIDLPTKGAHLFRHCFAGRMVQQGNSLKAVADMLGHSCLSTTFIYTKIDFNALKQVALSWPVEDSTC